MNQKKNLSTSSRCATFVWAIALALIICAASAGKVAAAAADSLDQLYEKAKKEGKITLYAPLSPQAMSVIPPAFMKRFPGVTVDHIDATSDKLIARVLSEQKGGRVLADVISGALTYLPQILDLKIVEQVAIPEAAAYPRPVERRPMGRNRHAILYCRMEHQSGQERRRAKKLRGAREP